MSLPHHRAHETLGPQGLAWRAGQGAKKGLGGRAFFFCFGFFFKEHISSVQSLSHVQLFATPWTAALQASLSITTSWSSPKLMSTESVMPSNHLIPCRALLLLPSIFPSIRVFSDESALRIRWPKCWSLSFNISPSNEHSGLISFSPRDSQEFSPTSVFTNSFFKITIFIYLFGCARS